MMTLAPDALADLADLLEEYGMVAVLQALTELLAARLARPPST
jgi:hypothetical protein